MSATRVPGKVSGVRVVVFRHPFRSRSRSVPSRPVPTPLPPLPFLPSGLALELPIWEPPVRPLTRLSLKSSSPRTNVIFCLGTRVCDVMTGLEQWAIQRRATVY